MKKRPDSADSLSGIESWGDVQRWRARIQAPLRQIPSEFLGAKARVLDHVARPAVFLVLSGALAFGEDSYKIPAAVLLSIITSAVLRIPHVAARDECAGRWRAALVEQGLINDTDSVPAWDPPPSELLKLMDHKYAVPLLGLFVSKTAAALDINPSFLAGFVTAAAVNRWRITAQLKHNDEQYTSWQTEQAPAQEVTPAKKTPVGRRRPNPAKVARRRRRHAQRTQRGK